MTKQLQNTEEDKAALKKIKAKVFSLEEDNFDHVYIYYSGNKWYKCGGKSAQYLSHILAPKFPEKYSPRLMPDNDFENVFKTGIISIRDLSKIRAGMESLKIEEEKRPDFKNFIISFPIGNLATKKEFRNTLKIDELKKQKISEAIALVHSDPEMAKHLRSIQKATYDTVKKMKTVDRDTLGKKLLETSLNVSILFRDWEKGALSEKEGSEKIKRELDIFASCLLIALENRIVAIETIGNLSFKVEAFRDALNKREKLIIKCG